MKGGALAPFLPLMGIAIANYSHMFSGFERIAS